MPDFHVAVYQHLLSVRQDPSKPLNEILLRTIDGNVAESLLEEYRNQLLGAIQELLPTIRQDAKPVTSLVLRLIQPRTVKFEEVDALLTHNGSSNDQYIRGLESLDKDVNILTLNLLNKAASSPSGIGLVASKVDVVQIWIKLWLTTRDIAVAERAVEVLANFLLAGVDCDQATIENNLMARRVFHDRDIYESLFSFCSFKTLGNIGQPDKSQKTTAQSRLLALLVKIDHTSSPIRTSQFPDIEERYGLMAGEQQGLLFFGFTRMVDYEDDDLILSTFIRICSDYIKKKCPKSGQRSTFALNFLKANQLHLTSLSYYMNPKIDDGSWLLADSATYLVSYFSVWQDDALKDENFCTKVVGTIRQRFKSASKGDWHSSSPLNIDLFVLGALPKRLHLPGSIGSLDEMPPLFHIPADTSSANVFNLLIHIFCRVLDNSSLLGEAATTAGPADRMTARVLYLYYHMRNPSLWANLVQVANTIALTASALAAIGFMNSFLRASWDLVDKQVMPSLPSEAELSQMRGGTAAPSSSIEAMIFEHGVAEIVLPYILAPPKSFNFSMQARSAIDNVSDPAKAVAKAKNELTANILQQLKAMEPTPEIRQIVEVFTNQVGKNSQARLTQGTGDSVATMRH